MPISVAEPTDPPITRGLRGVIAAETAISDVRGSEGFYHYRQYSAIDLARSRSVEDVWQLLVDGALPGTRAEQDAFRDEVRPWRALPPVLRSILPTIARISDPMTGLRTALSFAATEWGLRPLYDQGPEARRRDALRIAAVTPTILAALHRLRHGWTPVPPRDDLDHAADFLWMVSGEEPDPIRVDAISRYLISTVDHGFNASTFTARVIASSGADMGAAVVGAIGALSGPLHGGAPSRALDLLGEIGSADRARDVVTRKITDGERIMGFGHAVYVTDDPRSVLLRETAEGFGGPLVELAVAVEQTVVDVLAERKPGHDLRANVEFYAAVVMSACGLPREMFTPTFASSRVIGWTANVLEQAADPKIIRPSAHYVGPAAPQPVPLVRTAG